MGIGHLGGIVTVKTAVRHRWKDACEVRGTSREDPGETLSLNIASGEWCDIQGSSYDKIRFIMIFFAIILGE